ncbi:MAG TPA: lipoate--protein ligase family protein [Armatimonadota bacterium]|nr:lipoate--protein ligase family protein [Armatimonadota bacterium]
MATWRLFLPGDGSGAYNMAADTALLESIRDEKSGPVLRFYRWVPSCVTLGKFQPAEGNVHLENCARLGIDVVKRPTGGRAIFHDHEVTFSVIIAEKDLPQAGTSIMDSYRVLGTALVNGLQRIGLAAELVDRHAKTRSGDPSSVTSVGNPACFAAKARCDLMVNNRKIIGCAQLRKNGVILQQNSLPLSVDFPRWEEVFFRSDWQAVAEGGAIDLWTAAESEIPYDHVVSAICAGFTDALGVEFIPGKMSEVEDARTQELVPEYSILSTAR